jgi:hypothetical protein
MPLVVGRERIASLGRLRPEYVPAISRLYANLPKLRPYPAMTGQRLVC